MDTARAALTVAALGRGDWHVRQQAARQLKNDVVGNGVSKSIYVSVGAASALLTLVRSGDNNVVAEALSATASLAVRCAAGVTALLDADAVVALLAALSAREASVVNSAARALRVLAQAPITPTEVLDDIADSPASVARLVGLVAGGGPVCADCAAILARIIRTSAHAVEAHNAGVLPALLEQLSQTAHPARTAAAVDALAAVALADRSLAVEIARAGVPRSVLPFVQVGEASLSLSACRLQARLRNAHEDNRIKGEVADTVVPVLVRLLDVKDRNIRISAPRALAEMVSDDNTMQKRAAEAGAVNILAGFFPPLDGAAEGRSFGKKRTGSWMNGKSELVRGIEVDKKVECMPAVESAMIGLAALCREQDIAIEQIISKGLLPHIVSYLGESSPKVVRAAAKCFRSLTHSVKVVRRDLAVGNVAKDVNDLLLRLLNSEDYETRRLVSCTICNVVLSFSPVQPVFLKSGGVSAVVCLLRSDDQTLRMNGMWAIKNLLFKADLDLKEKVMTELSYEYLLEICSSACAPLREHALSVLRNLACVGTVRTEIEHLDRMLARMGDDLMTVLAYALKPGSDACPKIAVQALYTVNNISSGAERHKMKIMHSAIPSLILSWISHPDDKARIAAVWCIINLSRSDATPLVRRPSAFRPPQRRRSERLSLLAAAHLPLPRSAAARAALESPPSPASPVPIVQSEDEPDPPAVIATDDEVEDRDDDSVEPMTLDSEGEPSEAASQDSVMVDAPAASPPDPPDVVRTPTRPMQLREGYQWRIEQLRELGFERKLRLLVNDAHVEVQGRARAALEQFSATDINTLDYSPHSLLTRLNPPQTANRQGRRHLNAINRAHRIQSVAHNASEDSSGGSNSDGSTLTAAVEAMNPGIDLD